MRINVGYGLRSEPQPRKVQYWLIVATTVVVASAVLAFVPKAPVWLRVLVAIAVVVVPLLLAEVRLRSTREESFRRTIRQATADASDALPQVRTLSPAKVGAHPAVRSLPYVSRDRESDFANALRRHRRLLVTGSSMAGKTHLALRLAQTTFGSHYLLRPAGGAALRTLLSQGVSTGDRVVIWLDDLQAYASSGGLARGDLEAFWDAGAVIIATIRSKEYRSLQPFDERKPPGFDVVDWFGDPIVLDTWSDTEIQRLSRLVSDEVILSSAREMGLSQYLGGAPLVTHELTTGLIDEPVGLALVRVAADWRRTGARGPVPRRVLELAVGEYAPSNAVADEAAITAGLKWATTLLNHTVALLRRSRQDSYELLDLVYDTFNVDLFDLDDSTRTALEIRNILWGLALEYGSSSDELFDIGYRALFHNDRADVALTAWQASTHPSAQYYLLTFLRIPVEPEKVEESAREASTGEEHAHAALALGEIGQDAAAEQSARRAAEAGDTSALFNLGSIRGRAGELDTAERLLLEAHEAGMPLVGYNLGTLYRRKENYAEAEVWFRRSAELNEFPGGMTALAQLLEYRGAWDEAEEWYLKSAETGFLESMAEYGLALCRRDDLDQAQHWLRKAALEGDTKSMYVLGSILEEQSPGTGADWLQRAAEAGFVPPTRKDEPE